MKKLFRVFCAISFSLILLVGCNLEKVDYVHKADWVYVNNSSNSLELLDGFNHMSDASAPLNITLNKGESYNYEFRTDGGEKADPKYFPCPFDRENVKIVINKKDTIQLKYIRLSVRNRDNYKLKKLSDRHFNFTYTFTDNILNELMKDK